MNFWQFSEKLAKVISEHRVITRFAGVFLCVYCADQIFLAQEMINKALEYEDLERARLVVDNGKWIIGQFVGLLAIGFSVYSGTGSTKK